MKSRNTTFNVLLVEDDPGDASLVRVAIEEGPYSCHIHHVEDGVEAMEALRKGALGEDDARLPDLVLLDLNMPRKSGHEVLAEMKANDQLKDIPVVVLTTSEADRDVVSAYQTGASGYVTKPVDVNTLFESIRSIEEYWFGLMRLPR